MSSLPTRSYAGITVPDTPLITKTLSFARAHYDDVTYNHVVRSWLFGCAIANKVDDLQPRDPEVHSVSTILHELGWDIKGEFISDDKRFEIDGANAARDFLKREAGDWDHRRFQLVWDAIALHATPSIAQHKEIEVVATFLGIFADIVGPDGIPVGGLSWDEYKAIVQECPRLGFREKVKEVMCGFCRTKPQTTYDNFVGQFGEKYVEGYSLVGNRLIDLFEGSSLED